MDQDPFSLLGQKGAEYYMGLALREARRAYESDEVPVGAVIVDRQSGQVVAKAHNQRELLKDPTAHAEVVAITQAAAHYRSWRLTQCVLFVTLEPCLMCSGAIVLARIPKVVYGADDPKAGAYRSVFDVLAHPSNNHLPQVELGVAAEESSRLLKDFFRTKRTPNGELRSPSGGSDNGHSPVV